MPYDLIREHQLTVPLILAPMAGTSTPELAAGVARAGGLGSLPIGHLSPEDAQQSIRRLRAMTDRPFNVNVFCHRPATRNPAVEKSCLNARTPTFQSLGAVAPDTLDEIYSSFVGNLSMLGMLLEERPAVVSFHFGLPDQKFIQALKDTGIRLWATVTNSAEAKLAVDVGIDAVIAQGFEAGGHRGIFNPETADPKIGTFALVRLLAMTVDAPVIAAGGIMDGAGIAASLHLGAVAAQLGTAFIACPESSADEAFRSRLLSPAAHHTTMTRVISGRAARCLANDFTSLGESLSDIEVPAYPLAYDAGKALNAAAKRAGRTGYGAQWAGQGAPLARSMPAEELVAVIRSELNAEGCLSSPILTADN